MMPKNLRSVVQQVGRVKKTVVSHRNFCWTPKPTIGNRVAAAMIRSSEEAAKMRAGLSPVVYIGFGYCGSSIWELIRIAEYRRACERLLENDKSTVRLWMAK